MVNSININREVALFKKGISYLKEKTILGYGNDFKLFFEYLISKPSQR